MGYVTMGILAITAVFMLWGFLLGLLRGFNRSLLRAVLVVASFVGAIVLRPAFTKLVIDVVFEGANPAESFGIGDSLPSALTDMISVLLEVIVGFAGYFVIFFALLFVSWLIVFPICKIFVKKGIRRRRFLGGIVGLLQGFVIAFAFCAPLTGLVVEVEKISKIQLDGELIMELPSEIGLEEYLESAPGKFYTSTGSWLFEILSTAETADGKKLSIDDAISIVSAVSDIANAISDLEGSMDIMTNPDATPQERVTAMKDLGNVLVNLDSSVGGLSDDAKTMINDVIVSAVDMFTPEGEEVDSSVKDAIENFDINSIDLASAGQAITGISTYIEKTDETFENSEPVTQEEVDMIINGLAGCDVIFSTMTQGEQVDAIIEIEDESHKAMFENSINNSTLSDADKAKMKDLFGLNA